MAKNLSQIDIDSIRTKTISGVVTFTVRTFFIQIFTFIATFILTILLDPSVFGVFFVVSAILNLFVYFSDVGLAAALIQKRENPQDEDLKTTFTIQQIIILTLVMLGLIFSGKIAAFYRLDQAGLMLLRVLIISLIFSSLKTIPSVILERNLSFQKLVIPQVAEHLVFYTTAIVLAFSNFGIASFTYAVLARGITGLALIYVLSPWMPKLAFSKESAKSLVTFGLPFQLNSILALLKDDLLTVFIGKILPYNQVGYIGWAQKFAFLPLRFFMDNVIKVTFPAYSRLQENPKDLASAVNKSLFFVTFFVYPAVFGIMAIATQAVNTIAGYNKWEPAIPLLYFFGINAIFASVNTTLTNTIFAIGMPNIILKLMVFWTILTWTLTYFLIKEIGFTGVAVASALVAASTTIVVYFAKKHIQLAILKNISGPLIISLLMFITVKYLSVFYGFNFFGLLLSIVSGIFIYITLSVLMYRQKLINDASNIARVIFKFPPK